MWIVFCLTEDGFGGGSGKSTLMKFAAEHVAAMTPKLSISNAALHKCS